MPAMLLAGPLGWTLQKAPFRRGTVPRQIVALTATSPTNKHEFML